MSQPVRAISTFLPTPEALVSTWRTLGPFGPAYRVDEVVSELENGDTLFRVSVPRPIGKDEEFERKYSEILVDPEAS